MPLGSSFGNQRFKPEGHLTTEVLGSGWSPAPVPHDGRGPASGGLPRDLRGPVRPRCQCRRVRQRRGDALRPRSSRRASPRQLPDREIHVIDSGTASLGWGTPGLHGRRARRGGRSGRRSPRSSRTTGGRRPVHGARHPRVHLARRADPAAAAPPWALLSVKPIITVLDGIVETAGTSAARAKARERFLEPPHGNAGRAVGILAR